MDSTTSLDYWRSYFSSADSDIFGIIDRAIAVAASDCPKEFRLRRDAIAERLFACRLARCAGCDRAAEAAGSAEGDGGDGGGREGGLDLETGASKESEVNGGRGETMNVDRRASNYSFGEAEALTDEIEEESRYAEEVFRIRQVLLQWEDEPGSVLFESLRRLQLLQLTVDLLKATEIGKAVNPLRKHASRDIRQLARTLIDGWKEKVDEWVKTTIAIAASEGTPDSVKPSVVDDEEEGLPSPPMDEAFFATQTGSMELSQFFDGMDDDGNPQQSGEFIKRRENGRRTSLDGQNIVKRKPQALNEANIIAKDGKNQQARKNEANVRLNKPVITNSGPGRLPKSTLEKKGNTEPKMQQKIDKCVIPKRSQVGLQDKLKCSDDAAVQVKLAATKRKLQERYQQAENAKRQRTVQVMELHDLPKQRAGNRNLHVKPGNRKRQWANGRR